MRNTQTAISFRKQDRDIKGKTGQSIFKYSTRLLSQAVGPGGIVTLVDNEVFRPVVEAAREVAFQDGLGALGITDLGIDRATGHVRNHGIATAPWVLGIAERVVLGSGLGEPDVSSVASKVAGLQSLGDVLLDNNGATGSVDEPRTCYSQRLVQCEVCIEIDIPFFILEISSLLNKPRVFSCRGQLMVTTSH